MRRLRVICGGRVWDRDREMGFGDEIGFEDVIISEYSIFYGITPPDTYAQ